MSVFRLFDVRTLSLVACVTLSAVIATGCSNGLKGTDRKPDDRNDDPITVDGDDDGYGSDEDCDDDDPNTYPGAEELCDGKDNDCDGVIPEMETDLDGDGVAECEEVCPPDGPAAGYIPTIDDCQYLPSPSGTAFEASIEWSLGNAMIDPTTGASIAGYDFAEYPDQISVFQSPAVGQATDDSGDGTLDDQDVPDIAVIMGDELGGDNWSVIRLISGDGSKVHATAGWQTFTNANGTYTYAPYLFSGLAMADTDHDGAAEIVTVVVTEETFECYPAIYEVVDDGAGNVSIELDVVYEGSDYYCASHAPALADVDGDEWVDVILGKNVLTGDDLTLIASGSGGRGWYGDEVYGSAGYWNSGYHSFAYDMDGDGHDMEIVAGRTVYNNDGSVFCELGSYSGSTWVTALDGYAAVADLLRFAGDVRGEPEIVITGNEWVSVFHGTPEYDPYGYDRCVMIDKIPNKPEDDPAVSSGLPARSDCNQARRAFGGQPTIADFDGDGTREIAVAGSCWYSVYSVVGGELSRFAMAATRDWSSASTGSTVFDFNGDGSDEVVFADEDALYVWGVDTAPGLDPWERLVPYLEDTNHRSWTIHEYPLVADVDGDGKSEIVVVNSGRPEYPDNYGIYVLGAADDDWVSARPVWNQHAYYITNIDDEGAISYASPNYAPYSLKDYNSFRVQAPGKFGALAAPNLLVYAEPPCQEGCGDITVWVQVANQGAYITVDSGLKLALYGEKGGSRTLLDTETLAFGVAPADLSEAVRFDVKGWDAYDHLVAVVDDPAQSGAWGWGMAKECDESDNEVRIPLGGLCP